METNRGGDRLNGKNVTGLIGALREDLTNQYGKYMYGQDLKSEVILVGEKLGSLLGHFDVSDIILLFSRQDTCILAAERIHKEDFSKLEWYLTKYKIYKIYKKLNEVDTELLVNLTVSKDYIEIISCREEWYQCVQEVYMEQ